jgi:hypothetical protein
VPDLPSQVLEIAIALAFVFFLFSLVASGITELVSALLRLRARTLESGLRELLADPATANELFSHPLVARLAKGAKRKTPSYLSPRNFSLALIDTIAPPAPGSTPGSRNVLAAVRDKLNDLPEELRKQLYPLVEDAYAVVEEAEGSLARFRASVETWFDDSMQRVSGWYKRRSQLIIYIVAAVVAIGLNVDTIRIADRLWDDNALRESVVGAAIETVRQPAADGSQTTTDSAAPTPAECAATDVSETEEAAAAEGGSFNEVDQAVDETQACLAQVAALQLPIGWSAANDDIWTDPFSLESLQTLGGWLVTFFAIALGAPFWFDALSKLARLRTTGPRPEASTPGSGDGGGR